MNWGKCFGALSSLAGAVGPMFAFAGAMADLFTDEDAVARKRHQEVMFQLNKVQRSLSEVKNLIARQSALIEDTGAKCQMSGYVNTIELAFRHLRLFNESEMGSEEWHRHRTDLVSDKVQLG